MKNIQKFFTTCVLAIILMIAGLSPVSAVGTTEGDFTYSLNNGNVTIEKYNGPGGDVTIPSKLGGYPVTTIGNAAFDECKGLTSVVIPTSVTKINDGYNPGPPTNDDMYLGAFSNCIGLKSVSIPSSVKSIGYYSFYNCSALTSVTIPEGVVSLGEGAFLSCKELTSVNLPSSLTNADGVILEGGVFRNCTNLSTINIPSGWTTIPSWEFKNCKSLTSIKIPQNITTIENGAFSGCTGLTSINIPKNVTTIDEFAFYEFDSSECKNLTIYGQKGSVAEQYAINNNIQFMVDDYQFTIDNGSAIFTGYTGTATTITIPSTLGGKPVTSIAESALADYIGSSVVIPNSVTSIGKNAFKGSNLSKVAIPDGVTNIGDSAFANCTELTEVLIGSGVTSIGNEAFKGDKLTKVDIPNSVTSLGDFAFANCYGLTDFSIGSGVISIGKGLFDGSKLVKLTVAENNSSYSVQDNVLFDKEKTSLILFLNKNIISYDIPTSVASIGDSAFKNADTLTNVTISENVTSIGDSAFANCVGITDVVIPQSIEEVGNNAFKDCSKLESAHFKGNAPQMGSKVFENAHKSFVIHYVDGKSGFTNPWNGYKTTSYEGPPVIWFMVGIIVFIAIVTLVLLLLLKKRKKDSVLDSNPKINEASTLYIEETSNEISIDKSLVSDFEKDKGPMSCEEDKV